MFKSMLDELFTDKIKQQNKQSRLNKRQNMSLEQGLTKLSKATGKHRHNNRLNPVKKINISIIDLTLNKKLVKHKSQLQEQK